jgi:Uma2 family endonuclease
MSEVVKILPHYTYEDYIHWEGRWEIIQGTAFAMSPLPRPLHQAVSGRIHAELLRQLQNTTCDCEVYQPIDYKISEDTVVNPDVLIVCQPITKAFLDFAPALIVEILSPSTRLKDRYTKYDLYRGAGVQYYMIVDADTRTVKIFKLTNQDEYQLIDNQAELDMGQDCKILLDIDSFWV